MALPVNGSTHLIPAYYSFYRPRKDERLSWPSWLTYSRWLTHISGHPSAVGRAQDRESSPARDRRSTTVPRHQLCARYVENIDRGQVSACPSIISLLPQSKCPFPRGYPSHHIGLIHGLHHSRVAKSSTSFGWVRAGMSPPPGGR